MDARRPFWLCLLAAAPVVLDRGDGGRAERGSADRPREGDARRLAARRPSAAHRAAHRLRAAPRLVARRQAALVLEGAPLGEAAILDVATGRKRVVTDHFEHRGFTRAYFLHNGDLLLCGPTSGPSRAPSVPRRAVHGRDVGPARAVRRAAAAARHARAGRASRRRTARCASPGTAPTSTTPMPTSPIGSSTASPRSGPASSATATGARTSSDVERAVDRNAVSPIAVLEVQGFRGAEDRELIFTAYAHQGGEVMGVDLGARDRRRFGDELLEQPGVRGGRGHRARRRLGAGRARPREHRDAGPARHLAPLARRHGELERLTYFNRYRGGYYAFNPTVSPDGRDVAFQLSIDGPVEGEGRASCCSIHQGHHGQRGRRRLRGLDPDRRLRPEPAGLDVPDAEHHGQDDALPVHGDAVLRGPVRDQLPRRPDALLDHEQPLDGRPDRHDPQGLPAGHPGAARQGCRRSQGASGRAARGREGRRQARKARSAPAAAQEGPQGPQAARRRRTRRSQ